MSSTVVSSQQDVENSTIRKQTTKRHVFGTQKAFLGFWCQCAAQLCMFTSYNILSNMSSSIHKDKAMVPMALLYATYIIFSFLAPLIVPLVNNRAIIICAICSIGYLIFSACNIIGTSPWLFVGCIICGCGSPVWVAGSVTTTKLSLYIAERELLSSIQQGGKLLEEISEEDPANHPIRQINDRKNEQQIDWYISTIIDKNNRLIESKLSKAQVEELKVRASSRLGAFNTISWLFTQASSIIGAALAFGLLHIHVGKDLPGIYESSTGGVRIMYGVFTFIALLSVVFYTLAASKVIPGRVFFTPNKLSKWDLHLKHHNIGETGPNGEKAIVAMPPICEESLLANDDDERADIDQDSNPDEIVNNITQSSQQNDNGDNNSDDSNQTAGDQSPALNANDDEPSMSHQSPFELLNQGGNAPYKTSPGSSSTTIAPNDNSNHKWDSPIYIKSRHLFPGKSLNDRNDDHGNFHKPTFFSLLTNALSTSARLATDRAIGVLLWVFLVAYCPLSFTLSAFTAKGGLKDEIGVLYVPLFIGLVAVADVTCSFILKSFLKSLTTARMASLCGISLQLLSIIFMYIWPYYNWSGKGDAWKYAAIVGIIQGIGDALAVSGLSTLLSILCRVDSRLMTSGFSLLMVGRGLGLCAIFLINSQTNKETFRTMFWPIIVAMIGLSIICQIISWVTNCTINIERVLPDPEAKKQKELEQQQNAAAKSDHVAVELQPVGTDNNSNAVKSTA